MSGPAFILVAGWAHVPSADSVAITTSTNELWLRCRDPRTAPSYAGGLASLLRDIGTNSIVVGWSMGGMVALETAALHPGLMRGLVVVSGTGKFCSGAGYEAGVPSRHVRAMARGMKRCPRLTLGKFFEQVSAPFPETGPSLDGKVDAACLLDPGELRQGLLYLHEFDIRSCLARIDIPVLVIHGREDRVVPWQAGQLLSMGLPDGRFLLHDEAGHAIPLQNPDRLALQISDFVGIIQESECR